MKNTNIRHMEGCHLVMTLVRLLTLPERLYRLYFEKSGMRVPAVSVKQAGIRGRILQYTAYPCSKRDLLAHPEIFRRAKELSGGAETLTHNMFRGRSQTAPARPSPTAPGATR